MSSLPPPTRFSKSSVLNQGLKITFHITFLCSPCFLILTISDFDGILTKEMIGLAV